MIWIAGITALVAFVAGIYCGYLLGAEDGKRTERLEAAAREATPCR